MRIAAWMGLAIMAILVGLGPTMAYGQVRDIDYDWVLSDLDHELAAFGPGISTVLANRDNDGNGIWDEDTLAMLSAILRGGSRVGNVVPTDVTQIQADFVLNRAAADTDMQATGEHCTALQGLGFTSASCKLTDLLKDPKVLGPRAGGMVADRLLDFMAGMATTGDTPGTFTFLNNYIDAIFDAFAATQDPASWTAIRSAKSHYHLNSSIYHRWGAGGDKRNMFGAAGSFDYHHNVASNGSFDTSASWNYGTPWAWSSANLRAEHNSDGTAALTQGPIQLIEVLMPGRSYVLTYTLIRTAGSITPSVGGANLTTRSSGSTYSQTVTCGSSGLVAFTPSNDFRGSVDKVSAI